MKVTGFHVESAKVALEEVSGQQELVLVVRMMATQHDAEQRFDPLIHLVGEFSVRPLGMFRRQLSQELFAGVEIVAPHERSELFPPPIEGRPRFKILGTR